MTVLGMHSHISAPINVKLDTGISRLSGQCVAYRHGYGLPVMSCVNLFKVGYVAQWVERRWLSGKLSLSCARLTAGQVTTLWTNCSL